MNHEGEVTAVINGVILNVYGPIAIVSPGVVPSWDDFTSPFPLRNKRDGNV